MRLRFREFGSSGSIEARNSPSTISEIQFPFSGIQACSRHVRTIGIVKNLLRTTRIVRWVNGQRNVRCEKCFREFSSEKSAFSYRKLLLQTHPRNLALSCIPGEDLRLANRQNAVALRIMNCCCQFFRHRAALLSDRHLLTGVNIKCRSSRHNPETMQNSAAASESISNSLNAIPLWLMRLPIYVLCVWGQSANRCQVSVTSCPCISVRQSSGFKAS